MLTAGKRKLPPKVLVLILLRRWFLVSVGEACIRVNLRRWLLLPDRQSVFYCHPGHEHTRHSNWVRSSAAALAHLPPEHPLRSPPHKPHQLPFCWTRRTPPSSRC